MANDKYNDYAAKVASAMGAPDMAAELIEEHAATQIADYLNAERERQGLSQREVARRMGVSASKVCRIEDSYDRDLNYADIESYAKVLGIELKILFNPAQENPAKVSEWLVYQVDGLLGKLKSYAPDAEIFQRAVDDFSGRALFPILRHSRRLLASSETDF